MRGHFRYLRFNTFPMTPRTPQCEVFWAFLSNSKHSGIPEDSKSPTLEVLGFTPTLGQSGVATTSPNQSEHLMLMEYQHHCLTTSFNYDPKLKKGQVIMHCKIKNKRSYSPIDIKLCLRLVKCHQKVWLKIITSQHQGPRLYS
jgi:hypothetical protein